MPTLYFLITTKHRYNAEPATFAIAQHPAEYMANHIKESLIFAMPITKGWHDAYKKSVQRGLNCTTQPREGDKT